MLRRPVPIVPRSAQRGRALAVFLLLLIFAVALSAWYAQRRDAPRATATEGVVAPGVTPGSSAPSPLTRLTRRCEIPFPAAGLLAGAAASAAGSPTTFQNRSGAPRVVDLIVDRQVTASVAIPARGDATVSLPARSYHWQVRSGAAWCDDGRFVREQVVELVHPLDIVSTSALTIRIDDDPGHPSGMKFTASDAAIVRSAAAPESAQAGVAGGLVLVPGPSGHYFVDGTLDGRAVRFLVDTGASSVVVPATLARELGHYSGPEVTSKTANGTVTGYRFTVRALTFGPFTASDATVVALPNIEVPLLGMSVLQGVDLQQTARGLELRPRR